MCTLSRRISGRNASKNPAKMDGHEQQETETDVACVGRKSAGLLHQAKRKTETEKDYWKRATKIEGTSFSRVGHERVGKDGT